MNPEVDIYISKLSSAWQRDIVSRIRTILWNEDPNIEEKIKWGTPAYEHNGLVVWLFCAKDWVHLSFPMGVLLDSSHGLFDEAADTTSKAKRTIKLRQGQQFPEAVIAKLVRQAVANNLSGKKVDFHIPKPGQNTFDLPADYETFLKENGLYDEYIARPYYQQKGWIEWIEAAKREVTRLKRKQTMLQELRNGTYMPPKREKPA